MTVSIPAHIEAYLSCVHCGAAIRPTDEAFLEYFEQGRVTCVYCGRANDWWEQMVTIVRDSSWIASQVFRVIGAQWTLTRFFLERERVTTLDLKDHGVPEDATILDISYTPHSSGEGWLTPTEIQSNHPYRDNQVIRHYHVYYPVPMPVGKQAVERTEIGVSVVWVRHSADNEALRSLVSAFRYFYTEQYVHAAIPANVAVEFTLKGMLTTLMRSVAGKDKVDGFLINAATYSDQLDILLPLLAKLLAFPALQSHIYDHLRTLRRYRNAIGHRGAPNQPIPMAEMANCLTAVVFALRYLTLLEPRLNQVASAT